MLWVAFPPALAVGAVGFASFELPAAVRAAQGHGKVGTFVVTYHSCGKTCTWQGDFVGDDGSDVRPKVNYTGRPPRGTTVGDRIRAIDTGSFDVYQYPGSLHWLLDLGSIAFGVAVGWWWGFGQLEDLRDRRRRRRRQSSASSGLLGGSTATAAGSPD